ncbi:MAG: TIGR04255 family protein [Candidatus Methylacidiphilales bacterium]|nr:TIGR04255 family protein [Candidatus Methylacidiphilales bacterium]
MAAIVAPSAMGEPVFNISIEETFPVLPKSPVAEAILEIKTARSDALQDPAFLESVRQALPDYSDFKTEPSVVGPAQGALQGVKGNTKDAGRIVHVFEDSFLFAWTQPYESWMQFKTEAMRLWQVYGNLTGITPDQVNRIGLRYVNQIDIPLANNKAQLDDYLVNAPEPPKGLDLPMLAFLHQHLFHVPGHDYAVRVLSTIQEAPGLPSRRLTLDIEAITEKKSDLLKKKTLDKRLDDMRWLKNKAFFGSLKPKAWEATL